MKKLIFLAGGAFLLFAPFKAQAGEIRTPQDTRGITLPSLDFGGVSVCNIDASTPSTNAVECATIGSTAGNASTLIPNNTAPTAPILVYGVVFSSVGVGNYIVIRDSNTPNLTSSTAAIVYANGMGGEVVSTAARTYAFKFPYPIKLTNGLSANIGTTVVNGGFVQILFRVPAGE